MRKPRLVLCGGASENDHQCDDRHVIELATHGANQNVNVRLEDVAKAFSKDLNARLEDLLEIAAYIYAADSTTEREGAWLQDSIEQWHRNFRFVIPVRDLEFWRRDDVLELMTSCLTFVADDEYSFQFVEATRVEEPKQSFLEFGKDDRWPFIECPRVLMFSGGLDSLAGAVETAQRGEPLVLVSHRSVSVMDSRQKRLFDEMQSSLSGQMIRIPVWVNKEARLGRESTQRSRTFLFWALGLVVAESVKADGVRFFENGIVSLNLPIADEVLGARASRTTHPHALNVLKELGSLITERSISVDNPYFFHTKREVIEKIIAAGAGNLIQYTGSCARTGRFRSGTQWHCGVCSQCIDRKIALLAASEEGAEPLHDYRTDVFAGPRKDGYARNMAINYVRHCVELDSMSPEEIAERFNLEISRAVQHEAKRSQAAEELIAAHKRHADDAMTVVREQLAAHAGDLLHGKLESSSLLSLIAGQEHLQSSWLRFARRIAATLSTGLPIAFQSEEPKNERRLQEVADAILASENPKLDREFPFLRWASSLTKPDWSAEELELWVEAKYVRKRGEIGRTEEAIAADVTKYQDVGRRVLFIVYDRTHAITNENPLRERVSGREGMFIEFVR